jgi:AcrR family transcriptional regulator
MSPSKKGNSKKREICLTTIDLIAERKLSRVSMRQIAIAMGMSLGNLHYHYPSKAILIEDVDAIIVEFWEKSRKNVIQNTELTAPQILRQIFEDQKTVLNRQPHYILVIRDLWVEGTKTDRIQAQLNQGYDNWRTDLESIIQKGVEEGDFAPGSSAMLPNVFISLFEGLAGHYFMDPEKFDVDSYIEQSLDAMMKLLNVSESSS